MPKAQLATLAAAPPTDPERWIYEIKYDGYRILAQCTGGKVRLFSRNGVDWTGRFPEIEEDLSRLRLKDSILDGEVVVLDDSGKSDFQRLQNFFRGSESSPAIYVLFDLPRHDGLDLGRVPVEDRKETLRGIIGSSMRSRLRFSEHLRGHPREVLAQACKLSLEGIIAKRLGSGYSPRRTTDWLKLRCQGRQEMIVCGFTESTNPAYEFGALLLGYHDGDGLHFGGKVGTGFDRKMRKELWATMRPLVTPKCPFGRPPPGYRKGVTWLRPRLVAEIQFTEWTGDGRLRHPSFKGLRRDKTPSAVVRERAAPP